MGLDRDHIVRHAVGRDGALYEAFAVHIDSPVTRHGAEHVDALPVRPGVSNSRSLRDPVERNAKDLGHLGGFV
ncbi:hypothetical protein D3C75_1255460 [compost metagenome]